MTTRHMFCSDCGTGYENIKTYPRTCSKCSTILWANPVPVVVTMVPVLTDGPMGLLVIRRAIEPMLGKIALPGGFLEEHETWEEGSSREIHEETSIVVDPTTIRSEHFASSHPRPNRIMLFSVAEPIRLVDCPPFEKNNETSERGLVFGPRGLSDIFSFPRHLDAVQKFFHKRDAYGDHNYTQF